MRNDLNSEGHLKMNIESLICYRQRNLLANHD